METRNLLALILIFAVIFSITKTSNGGTDSSVDDTTSDTTPDYSALVTPDVSLTGQNLFSSGTSLSSEYVKIIKNNGARSEAGMKSLNSGTINVEPNVKYDFYFFFNATSPSSIYYVDKQEYTGPAVESTKPLIGKGCEMDIAPIFASYDSNGNKQTATTNAQVMAASTTYDMELMINAHTNECYGMPDAQGKNAICFLYLSGANFTSIKTSTQYIGSAPKSITSSSAASGKSISCYEFPTISDFDGVTIPYQVITTSNPSINHNITVMSADIAFDLNSKTLAEIWGYDDEVGNDLGVPAVTLGTIYIS